MEKNPNITKPHYHEHNYLAGLLLYQGSTVSTGILKSRFESYGGLMFRLYTETDWL